jgi:membrane fusion protein (multidrug efflux system)
LDKKYVFVVGEDQVVKSRRIHIGEELTHLYTVRDGLDINDRILVEGLRKVKENDKIDVEFIAPDSLLSQLDLYAE